MPPLQPIRASVFASMEEQSKVNALYAKYVKGKDAFEYKHSPRAG